jgi:hypothetical protein
LGAGFAGFLCAFGVAVLGTHWHRLRIHVPGGQFVLVFAAGWGSRTTVVVVIVVASVGWR